MSAIDELQAAIQVVATRVGPAVVGIGRHQRGSGVVVADGRVLTNAHNVRGEQVTVTFADGRSTAGRLAGIDVDGDLAVIEVDTAGATPLAWGAGDGLAPVPRCSVPRPRRPAARGSRSGPSRRSPGRSGVPAGGGSAAASSTPRRWLPARRAVRSSTSRAASSG